MFLYFIQFKSIKGIEKCVDVTTVAKLLNGIDCAEELKANNAFLKDHLVSPIIHNSDVKKQVAEIKVSKFHTFIMHYAQT